MKMCHSVCRSVSYYAVNQNINGYSKFSVLSVSEDFVGNFHLLLVLLVPLILTFCRSILSILFGSGEWPKISIIFTVGGRIDLDLDLLCLVVDLWLSFLI